MKVLYVGLLYDYGKPEQGFSYEYHNIEQGFMQAAAQGMFELDLFHPDVLADPYKRQEACVAKIQEGNFDAIFHVAFDDHLDLPEAAAKLALKLDIPVIQWDCDSSWRFHNWIQHRSQRASHFVTTHSAAVDWYKQAGMNVIRSQWAGSPLYVKDPTVVQDISVSFIGQKHGIRDKIIAALDAEGIKVNLYGNYWDGYDNWGGYLTDFKDMLNIFQRSKICLNLSNPWHVGTMPQIKGRHFEIPQCGGFQISTPADDLSTYFTDEEIVIADTIEALSSKIKFYLSANDSRQKIADAGYLRMQKEHQWTQRLEDIFKEIGLL
jgi:spore maturation protein CgeB